jgi:hypothetical protein
MSTETTTAGARTDKELRELAEKFEATRNIVALESLSQPLVDQMHAVIRWQAEVINRQSRAVVHVLHRIKDDPELQNRLGICTESFSLLTKACAASSGDPLAQIQEYVITGSSKFHQRDNERD